MAPVLDSLPDEWEVLVWLNGSHLSIWRSGEQVDDISVPDLAVYGRYAAIKYAAHDLIYVADDDVIVSDPNEIVEMWKVVYGNVEHVDYVVCNQPQEFRHDGYTDSALVGFGACFHRDAPTRAFERFYSRVDVGVPLTSFTTEEFNRTCDVVFTTLTPRVLVDVSKQDREFASEPNRMWKQEGHLEERTRMLNLARKVRDA